MNDERRILVLHRNDLRVLDQPALSYAEQNDLTPIGCFIAVEQQWQSHGHGQRKIHLIRDAAQQVEAAYLKAGYEFLWIEASTYSEGVEKLDQWLAEHPVDAIALHAEYEFNEYQRDLDLAERARERGIPLRIWHDQLLMNPENILNGSQQPFKVFTPFAKKWRSLLTESAYLPAQQSLIKPLEDSFELKAHDQLNQFLTEGVQQYSWARDRYDIPGTSELSAWLSIGALSLRSSHWAAMQQAPSDSVEKWRTELIWRSFYKYICYWNPHVCQGYAFRAKGDELQWDDNPGFLRAWQQGKTGFPIVDAAQRCLYETGYMPNRLRMVTAMFLTKDLGLDWRLGESWFMQHLLDGDFASNNGGWQWSASTGVDAAPYFRIFNPVEQSKKFDPDGNFIRRWVSELQDLATPDIHFPNDQQRLARGYPTAVVDHKEARERTLARFKQATAEAG